MMRSAECLYVVAISAGLFFSGCADAMDKKNSEQSVTTPPITCPDDVASRAAAEARQFYPGLETDQSTPEELNRRDAYLDYRRWKLFDENHDNYIDEKEYSDFQWASMLVHLPDGQCTINRHEFVRFSAGGFIVRPGDTTHQIFVDNAGKWFDKLDVDKKGYLVRSDIDRISKNSFRRLDKNHDGKLSRDELPDYPIPTGKPE